MEGDFGNPQQIKTSMGNFGIQRQIKNVEKEILIFNKREKMSGGNNNFSNNTRFWCMVSVWLVWKGILASII